MMIHAYMMFASVACLTNRVSWLCGKDEGNNQTVQAQHLSENENQDHADVQTWLLSCSSYTGVSNDADGETGSQARQAYTKASAQMVKAPIVLRSCNLIYLFIKISQFQ